MLAAASIPTLRALGMCMCTSVTDASITALAAQRPGLMELKLDWCSKVCGQEVGLVLGTVWFLCVCVCACVCVCVCVCVWNNREHVLPC